MENLTIESESPVRAYRVAAVSRALGNLGEANVRKLIASGDLAAVRAGRHWLVSEDELRRFINVGSGSGQ
ncbi:helix-turn-helix domain-containing protein [Amycolatopsis sp. NBC_01480]|uniref:helix-turn-helix domain-containing protein n=1 Tax=Amycolatopsis sp. NBC_01480 TaxID=2903562 RepID=UPI002E2CC6C4|nr:helix-turn-helix domain-containing protein [Amycolatopsis sp. NBC_01480]